MEADKIEFTRERISTYMKATKEYIESTEYSQVPDYMVENVLLCRLDAFIMTHLADERVLTYICPRPKFFDWLFRREKRIEWKVQMKDVFINPPKIDWTNPIYIIDNGKYSDNANDKPGTEKEA